MSEECKKALGGVPMNDSRVVASRHDARPQQVEEWVERSKRGETTAFDKLVNLYKDRIYNYVSRMVHDPIEAEDIRQETFVKAYRNLSSFQGASTFQTWLYRIASNLTIDAVRRRRRRENTCSLDAPLSTEEGDMAREQEDTQAPGLERNLETAELQRCVHRAIQQLSPKLRSVVVLYELQGLSYEEIAAILGCPLGTVKSRLFNARMELYGRLKDILPPYDADLSEVLLKEQQTIAQTSAIAVKPDPIKQPAVQPAKATDESLVDPQVPKRPGRVNWRSVATGFPGAEIGDLLGQAVLRRWGGIQRIKSAKRKRHAKQRLIDDLREFEPNLSKQLDLQGLTPLVAWLRKKFGKTYETATAIIEEPMSDQTSTLSAPELAAMPLCANFHLYQAFASLPRENWRGYCTVKQKHDLAVDHVEEGTACCKKCESRLETEESPELTKTSPECNSFAVSYVGSDPNRWVGRCLLKQAPDSYRNMIKGKGICLGCDQRSCDVSESGLQRRKGFIELARQLSKEEKGG